MLANLGKHGALTAREICKITFVDKTKVSRAVQGLEDAGLLQRQTVTRDRRLESLSLTDGGRILCHQLGRQAVTFDQALRDRLGPVRAEALADVLQQLATWGQNV